MLRVCDLPCPWAGGIKSTFKMDKKKKKKAWNVESGTPESAWRLSLYHLLNSFRVCFLEFCVLNLTSSSKSQKLCGD